MALFDIKKKILENRLAKEREKSIENLKRLKIKEQQIAEIKKIKHDIAKAKSSSLTPKARKEAARNAEIRASRLKESARLTKVGALKTFNFIKNVARNVAEQTAQQAREANRPARRKTSKKKTTKKKVKKKTSKRKG